MFKDRFKLDPNDFVIVVLGRTGCGKTNLINKLTGNAEQRNASNLKSDTENVTPYPISYEGQRLVLVDTPGFDDTSRPDSAILRVISLWLTQRYPDGTAIRISGIIYVHRITDNHMSGSALKNLQLFGRLCGTKPLPRTCLVTTMWDQMRDQGVAKQRETELTTDFWRTMIDGGATVHPFYNTPASAWSIVTSLLLMGRSDDDLLLQDELLRQQKRLSSTEAGEVLHTQLQQLLIERRKMVKELADQAKMRNDPSQAESLQAEYNRVDGQLQQVFEEMQEMKLPLSERIIMWLCGGTSLAEAVQN